MPLNGWNCRCTVQSLSAGDLKRRGLAVSEPPPSRPRKHRLNTPDGPVTVTAPEGIDPGFAYNPGRAAAGHGADTRAMEGHGRFEPLSAPGGTVPRHPPVLPAADTETRPAEPVRTEAALRAALRTAIGGDEKVFRDPAGGAVRIGQAIVDHMLADTNRIDGRDAYFPLLPELIEDPAEIWVGFAAHEKTGRVVLRRRYVKIFALDKNRVIGLVADQDNGYWSGLTFFRGRKSPPAALRTGLRIYSAFEER